MKNIIIFCKKNSFISGKILYFNLFGMILISLFEGIGIFLLIPLISLTGILDVSLRRNSSICLGFEFFKEYPKHLV